MPGHVKRGGTGEPDPDPTPFLYVSYNEKQKDMAKVTFISFDAICHISDFILIHYSLAVRPQEVLLGSFEGGRLR